jgi:endonuclease/exonuclease/phosphatase family metal-dependent hydrolase
MTITVLTVNLHKGFGVFNRRFVLPELREAVRGVAADLVFLQEVMGEHALHAAQVPGWPQRPHYEFLADALWSDYAYGRNAVYPQGHHGNALLSKFVIGRHCNHDVSAGRHERRGLLHCTLDLPGCGRVLHAICVHLGLRETQRALQLQQLRALVQGLPPEAPLVVAGDFNDWRRQAERWLGPGTGLEEVFEQAWGTAARTFPARWPLLPLDRIYVRGVRLHRPLRLPRHPWSQLSDHAPLLAEISL